MHLALRTSVIDKSNKKCIKCILMHYKFKSKKSVNKRFFYSFLTWLTTYFMKLIDKWFEIFDLVTDFLLCRTWPCFCLKAELLKSMTEDSRFLFIKSKALCITLLINLADNIFHVKFYIINHFINLFNCFLDLSFLNLAHLYCIYARFLNSLQMNLSNLLNVGN